MLTLSCDGTLTLDLLTACDVTIHHYSKSQGQAGNAHAPSGMEMRSLCLKRSPLLSPLLTPISVGEPQASRQNTQNSYLHLFISISFINLRLTFRTNQFYVPSVFSICAIFTHSFYKYLLTTTPGPDPGFGSVLNTKKKVNKDRMLYSGGDFAFSLPLPLAILSPLP